MTSKELFDPRPKVKKRLNFLPENPEKESQEGVVGKGRFPSWLHRPLPQGNQLKMTRESVDSRRLHTVCEEAKCPNLLQCWSQKTATFLVMGKECTRACGFCDIDTSKAPPPLSDQEPEEVADAVVELGLRHVVITMVARDDLNDGGAAHLVKVVEKVREKQPDVTVELLTSDLEGNFKALDQLLSVEPEIFNHNIETVRRLTPRVRHKATYERTLSVLEYAKQHTSDMLVKSGLMVGLGEEETEVKETLRDLKAVGCGIVTIGQYLQASRLKLRVKEFVHPDQFKVYEEYGKEIGIDYTYSGPFVRSSFNAGVVFEKANQKKVIESE